MHSAAFDFVRAVATAETPRGPVLEIGARNINGTIRDLFPADNYVGLDVEGGPGVDVVADGATYQPAAAPACVVCCEVLEHAPNAEAICRHAHAILQPGGMFIVTAAGEGRAPHSAVDGGPVRQGEFYRNVWAHDLRRWLSDFVTVTITENPHAGDVYAVATKAES